MCNIKNLTKFNVKSYLPIATSKTMLTLATISVNGGYWMSRNYAGI